MTEWMLQNFDKMLFDTDEKTEMYEKSSNKSGDRRYNTVIL